MTMRTTSRVILHRVFSRLYNLSYSLYFMIFEHNAAHFNLRSYGIGRSIEKLTIQNGEGS